MFCSCCFGCGLCVFFCLLQQQAVHRSSALLLLLLLHHCPSLTPLRPSHSLTLPEKVRRSSLTSQPSQAGPSLSSPYIHTYIHSPYIHTVHRVQQIAAAAPTNYHDRL